ncbi:MAG: hypothetical protein FJY53_05635 [Betaproteobacteria bacterium]|nr:hypothetical protein [Betaproteobacteria bacterium]
MTELRLIAVIDPMDYDSIHTHTLTSGRGNIAFGAHALLEWVCVHFAVGFALELGAPASA